MNRVFLEANNSNNVIELIDNSSGFYFVDLNKTESNSLTINVASGNHDTLIVPSKNKTLFIDLKEGVATKISLLAKENVDNFKISTKLAQNSSISLFFADFSKDKCHVKVNADLNGKGSSAYWHLSSLAAGKDNKEFEIEINHNAVETFARSDNYGVCKNDAKLIFSGTSTINHGCAKSKTSQNSKIMVFDRLSNACAKPILKIDENDIEASHAAVVGKINDEHLFYLTSRGLTEDNAKELITFGYLKPILVGFSDENIKEEINSLIERRM